jgi:hypothetical protein
VDDEVTGSEGGSALFVQAETVDSYVAGYRSDPTVGHLDEFLRSQVGPKALEGVVAQDVSFYPPACAPPAWTYDQDQFTVRGAAQETFHEGGAEKAGASCDGDAASGQFLGDHPSCLPDGQAIYQLVEKRTTVVPWRRPKLLLVPRTGYWTQPWPHLALLGMTAPP